MNENDRTAEWHRSMNSKTLGIDAGELHQANIYSNITHYTHILYTLQAYSTLLHAGIVRMHVRVFPEPVDRSMQTAYAVARLLDVSCTCS